MPYRAPGRPLVPPAGPSWWVRAADLAVLALALVSALAAAGGLAVLARGAVP